MSFRPPPPASPLPILTSRIPRRRSLLGRPSIMDTPRIPKYHIPRPSIHVFPRTPLVLEPLQLTRGEMVRIDLWPTSLGFLMSMFLEELFVQGERTREDHEASVTGSVGGEVHYPLDTVEFFLQRGLIDVGPGSTAVLDLFSREGDGKVGSVCRRRASNPRRQKVNTRSTIRRERTDRKRPTDPPSPRAR